MIELTTTNGRKVYLAPGAIAEVVEAGPSSQWHGVCAYVRTFDGRTIEAQERAEDIVRKLHTQEAR